MPIVHFTTRVCADVLSFVEEASDGLAVLCPTLMREVPGSTPGGGSDGQ